MEWEDVSLGEELELGEGLSLCEHEALWLKSAAPRHTRSAAQSAARISRIY